MVGMGIAQELDQTVDAYKNNSAGLQKAQQLDPSTIKLLALERINREMKAKTNDINMSLDNNPQTIAAKKESEVLNNVMNTLVTDKAKKDANIRKVASTGVAPQSIAELPASNMRTLAGGGIIGFAGNGENGSLVGGGTAERIEALRAKLATGGLEEVEIAAIEKMIESLEVQMGTDNAKVIGADTGAATGDESLSGIESSRVGDDFDPALNITDPTSEKKGSGIKSIMSENTIDPNKFTLNPKSLNLPTVKSAALNKDDYQSDYSNNPYLTGIAAMAKKDANINPIEVQNAALEKAEKYMGRTPEEIKRQIDRENSRKQLYKDQTGTKYEQKKESLIQSLINARGTDSGTALASGARAAKAFDAKQDSLQRAMLETVIKDEKSADKTDQTIRKNVYDSSIRALETASKDKRTGKQILNELAINYNEGIDKNTDRLLTMNTANLNSADKQRALELKAIVSNLTVGSKIVIANLEGKLMEQKNNITAAYNKAMSEGATLKSRQDTYVKIQSYLDKSRREYEAAYNKDVALYATLNEAKRAEVFPGTGGDMEKVKAALAAQRDTGQGISSAAVASMLADIQKKLGITAPSSSSGSAGKGNAAANKILNIN